MQSTFGKESSRLFTLLPDFKISNNLAIFPLSSADDPVLVQNQNSASAEGVLKKHTSKQMTVPLSGADAAPVYLRTKGRGVHSRDRGGTALWRGHGNGPVAANRAPTHVPAFLGAKRTWTCIASSLSRVKS